MNRGPLVVAVAFTVLTLTACGRDSRSADPSAPVSGPPASVVVSSTTQPAENPPGVDLGAITSDLAAASAGNSQAATDLADGDAAAATKDAP
jgi:hypothetical protein